jgi:hypothetical protein
MTARKPPHLKQLANTARRDRFQRASPGLPALDSVPTMPLSVTSLVARQGWARLALLTVRHGLLTGGSVEPVDHSALCTANFMACGIPAKFRRHHYSPATAPT